MAGPLTLDREEIARLCRAFGVKRLAVFGSATTDRFDPDRSDVDFLVEFRDDARASFKTYCESGGLKDRVGGVARPTRGPRHDRGAS